MKVASYTKLIYYMLIAFDMNVIILRIPKNPWAWQGSGPNSSGLDPQNPVYLGLDS